MVPKYAPGDTVYFDSDPGMVVWVDDRPPIVFYKVLWDEMRQYGWNEADACLSAWYTESCLTTAPDDLPLGLD